MAPLEKLDISKINSPGISLEQPDRSFPGVPERVDVVAPATPVPCFRVVSERSGIAPETPVQSSIATRPFEQPLSPSTPNYESLSRPSFFESPRRDRSPSLDLPLDLNLVDEVWTLLFICLLSIRKTIGQYFVGYSSSTWTRELILWMGYPPNTAL